MRKKTQEEFIIDSNIKHNNFYDYCKSIYVNTRTDLDIMCPIHGIFSQKAGDHLQGKGCKDCGGSVKITRNEFINRSNEVHNNKYGYSEDFENQKTEVEVICPIHDKFTIKPILHMSGKGCIECHKEYLKKDYIKKANIVHNNKYTYLGYVNTKKDVEIICPIHGLFTQRASSHLSGNGCDDCVKDNLRSSNDKFIKDSNITHDNFFTYENVLYIGNKNSVNITCPMHGNFTQRPNNHLSGQGCPKCNSSKGEKKVMKYLDENNIEYKDEMKFNKLGLKRFDFYLPELNICIEYDGIFHYEAFDFIGGNETLCSIQESDRLKNQYCIDNNIDLIRIPYWDLDNIEIILNNFLY
jgi:hypothetical protein